MYFIFYFFGLYLRDLFFRSSKYKFVYVLFAALLYFPLTYSPISILPNLAGSFLSMAILYVLSLLCYNGKWIYKFLVILLYNIFDILIGNIFFYIGTLSTGKNFSELSIPGSITRILHPAPDLSCRIYDLVCHTSEAEVFCCFIL